MPVLLKQVLKVLMSVLQVPNRVPPLLKRVSKLFK